MIERFFIEQSMKKIELERFVKKQLEMAGFTNLEIVKTPLVTRIVLHVVRPGLAIGKGGQTINQLTEEIGKKFGIENPQIEIQEIKSPNLDAAASVDKIVSLLERGYSWRSIVFRSMQDIMNAGAQGAELVLSGKLAGKGGRKRRVRFAQGYMKKVGNQVNLVDFAKATAYPKQGAIGIKIRIIRPGVLFPDKIDINQVIAKEKGIGAAAAEAQAKADLQEQKTIAEAKEEKSAESAAVEAAKPVSKTAKKRAAKKAKEEGKAEGEKEKEASHEKKEHAKKEALQEKKPKEEIKKHEEKTEKEKHAKEEKKKHLKEEKKENKKK